MTTSPLKVEDSRADFEKWMTDEQWFHGSDFEWDEGRNCYSQFGIHIAYKAWQASRAAIVVELPDEVNVLLNHLEDVLPFDVFNLIDVKKWNAVSSLSATGITVKGD